MLLDVLALLDELVLGSGAGKAALSGSASLSGEAWDAADGLSCGRHFYFDDVVDVLLRIRI